MRGYQQLRLFAGMSPNGCAWRWAIYPKALMGYYNFERHDWDTPFKCIEGSSGPVPENRDRLVTADQFIRGHEDFIEMAKGEDPDYMSWFDNIVEHAKKQDYPIAFCEFFSAKEWRFLSGEPLSYPPFTPVKRSVGRNMYGGYSESSILGAIVGDIAGSTYEFHNTRDYDFELFPKESSYTDDTVCTIAIADAIVHHKSYRNSLLKWCRNYPHPKGAYGNMFNRWIHSEHPHPYKSFGNGSAMRVSPVGWAFNNSSDILEQAEKSASCTHSHSEGIKGAQAIALAIRCLIDNHGNDIARQQVGDICAGYYGADYADHLPQPGVWDGTCPGCVPLAFHLFLKSYSFEDAIRLAISYGGDSDTLGAIVGSLAGAYYGVPLDLCLVALSYLPNDMKIVLREFEEVYIPTL